MLELLRQWLVGITCAAMVAAVAQALSPPGAVKRIGKFTGGLMLLVAVVKPIASVDGAALTRVLTDYQLNLGSHGRTLEEENRVLMKTIIEERSAAYIVDKADAMGLSCTVAVEADESGEWPIPWTVTVWGALDGEERAALTQRIESDFAIPEHRQFYVAEEDYESGDGA